MARIRTVKPEFWADEIIGSLSREARLLFIASWNLADDTGRLRWTAQYLKASAFMYDDDLTTDDVIDLMAELDAAGLVHPYTAGRGQNLATVVNFRKHQSISKPQASKLPPPPDDPTAPQPVDGLPDDSGNTPGTLPEPIHNETVDDGAPAVRESRSDDHDAAPTTHAPALTRANAPDPQPVDNPVDPFPNRSGNVPGTLPDNSRNAPGGKGREGKGKEAAACGSGNARAREPRPLPPAIAELATAAAAAGLHARFDRLDPTHQATIADLIAAHGIRALITSAKAQHRRDAPAAFAQAWIPAWQQLTPPGTTTSTTERCNRHPSRTLPCRDCRAEAIAGLPTEAVPA